MSTNKIRSSVAALALIALCHTPLAAQQVITATTPAYAGTNTTVIIDSRTAPPAGITFTAKPLTVGTSGATNTAQGSNIANHLGSALNNATVSAYFAVSKIENGYDQWAPAFGVCTAYDSADGTNKWRLPTQREQMLIWVLKDKLVNAGVASFATFYRYWSATEIDAGSSWISYLANGSTGNHAKTANNRVRCVRDLTP